MTRGGRAARRPSKSAGFALAALLLLGSAQGAGAEPAGPEAGSGGLVEIAWPQGSRGGTLVVERSEEDGPFHVLATLPAGTTSYRDATLPAGRRACYRVRAVGDASPTVAAACVESPAPGLPPVAAPPPGDETTRVRQRGPGGWYQRIEIPSPDADATPPGAPPAEGSP